MHDGIAAAIRMISDSIIGRLTMKIREATRVDAKWIIRHRIGMFEAMGEPEDFIKKTRSLTEKYIRQDWTKDYRYFLLEEEGEVLGGCGLSTFRIPPLAHQPTGVYGYVSNMFVEPNHRRNGLGKKLLEHVIEYCKTCGIGMLLLHSSKGANSLYESLGFSNPRHLMHLLVGKLA